MGGGGLTRQALALGSSMGVLVRCGLGVWWCKEHGSLYRKLLSSLNHPSWFLERSALSTFTDYLSGPMGYRAKLCSFKSTGSAMSKLHWCAVCCVENLMR